MRLRGHEKHSALIFNTKYNCSRLACPLNYKSCMYHVCVVLGTVGILAATGGTFTACLADRYPQHSDRLENLAGVLMIGGLALLSLSMGLT